MVKIKVCGDGEIKHVYHVRKVDNRYYLSVNLGMMAEDSQTMYADPEVSVDIPIDEAQYNSLKRMLDSADAECPRFKLRGGLEISVEGDCIN